MVQGSVPSASRPDVLSQYSINLIGGQVFFGTFRILQCAESYAQMDQNMNIEGTQIKAVSISGETSKTTC